MHVAPSRIARIAALALLCVVTPVAVVSILAGGFGLLWTISTADDGGSLGLILVYGLPALCVFIGVWAFNRRAYAWALGLSLPTLCLLLFFVATARF